MSIIASLNFAWVSSYVIKETEVIREKIKTQSSILIVIDSVSYQALNDWFIISFNFHNHPTR